MLEYLNEIEAQLLIWLPTIGSVILSVVVPFITKLISNKIFNKQDKELKAIRAEMVELKEYAKAVAQENVALKKTINKTLTEVVDHVHREDAEA